MYTFVMMNSKSLRATIVEPINENDDFINSFRFLIPQKFNDFDMRSFYVLLQYIAPDGLMSYQNVDYDNNLYQGMLSIVVPITRKFTFKQGTLKVALGFISKDSVEVPPSSCTCEDEFVWSEIGSNPDTPITPTPGYLDISFSTSYASIPIQRTTYQSDMSIINRFIQKVNHLEQTMPDNLRTYPDSMEMQLESKSKPVGDRVKIPCDGESEGDSEWSEISDYNFDTRWNKI